MACKKALQQKYDKAARWYDRAKSMLNWFGVGRPRHELLQKVSGSVLEAYALIHRERSRHHHSEPRGAELAAFLHRDEQVAKAQRRLIDLVRDLLAEAAEAGDVRNDVTPDELASYCLHALTAASSLAI